MVACLLNLPFEAMINVNLNIDLAAVLMAIGALISQYHNYHHHNNSH